MALIKIKASDEDGNLPVDNTIKDGILTERLNSNREIKYPVKIDPTWQVGTGTDDAYRRIETDNFWNLTDNNITVGAYNGTYYEYGGGMRFTNITIPQGATITEAYLTLRCSNTGQGATNSRISAEDVDDAPTFADNKTTFDTRWAARTTARVDWDAIPDWTLNNDYNSPEIKTVIQEIVDRGGWSSGNDIVIFWDDFEDRSTLGSGSEPRRFAWSYDGTSTYAPKLVVTIAGIPTTYGLTAAVSVDRNIDWDRATLPGLSIAVTILKGLWRAIATSTNLAVSATISRFMIFTRSTSPGLTIATTINRVISFVRSTAPGLTVSTTIDRFISYTRSTAANLTISATVARTVVYTKTIASNLSAAVTIIRGFGHTVRTTANLVISATVKTGFAYKVSTSTNLAVSVIIHYCTVLKELARVAISRIKSSRLNMGRLPTWRKRRNCE